MLRRTFGKKPHNPGINRDSENKKAYISVDLFVFIGAPDTMSLGNGAKSYHCLDCLLNDSDLITT